MNALPAPKLSHFGIYARDLNKMVEFYTRIFGLTVSDWGSSKRGMDIAFLTGDPEEHHQLVIASGRPEDATFSTVNQVSFRVNDLEELRQYYARVAKEGVKALETRNHGNAWSIYFSDPEGNRMEIYLPTPWYVAQPRGEPLDLTQPADKIIATTEAMVREDPSYRPMSEWSDELIKKRNSATA
jgi:catechol 2,3-dioxygenase